MKRLGALAAITLAAWAQTASAQDTLETGLGDLPPGMGTLTQGDIALTFRGEELEIRVVPLDERLLRLLAPDSYQSLHDLVKTRSAEIDSVSRQNGVSLPGLLLVTFFGVRQGARFDPQNVNITVRNQLFRPIGVVPYSTNFNSQQLDRGQQATGIILFQESIPVFEPLVVSYGAVSSSWESKLGRIQRERSRVLGRINSDSARSRPDSVRQ